ncbi:MAG: hypothetical protein J7L37_04275 [Thermococcus sp.]|nr:hypothetical protein [Thermococcus sp.]
MKKVHVVVVATAVIILSLVFCFGSFTLASSKTHTSIQRAVAKSADAAFNEGFCVYPNSPLGKMVAEELRARGHRVLTLSSPIECDGQFLAVSIEWVNISYFPLTAKGHIRAITIYSSAGDPTHYLQYRDAKEKEKALKSFERTQRPQLQAYLLVDVFDESKGLICLRGYQDHLIRETAKAIAGAVERLSKEDIQ